MVSDQRNNCTDLEFDETEYYDYHAAQRDRKLQKRRYGMRVSGRSVRLLEELSYRKKGDGRDRR